MADANVKKAQQNQSANIAEQNRVEKQQKVISAEEKQKFERLTKLWDLYKGSEKKGDEEILNGPMDILRQVGQFLVALSDKDNAVGNLEQKLQNPTLSTFVVQEPVAVKSTKDIDIDALTRLVDRIIASPPSSEVPEVSIKVSDSILPDTDIVLRHVGGALQVQITSDSASVVSLLGLQGSALQQMLEEKTGGAVVVQVNTEQVTRREEGQQGQSGKDKQSEQEQHNENR